MYRLKIQKKNLVYLARKLVLIYMSPLFIYFKILSDYISIVKLLLKYRLSGIEDIGGVGGSYTQFLLRPNWN